MAVAVAALLPIAFVGWAWSDVGTQQAIALIFRGRVAELLANTFLLEAIALPVCIALAVVQAWLTERSGLPGRRIWAWLAVAPLTVPAFVHGYAWVTLVPGFHGLPAGVLLSIAAYLPFLYLPVAATLRRLDPALEDVAASLGLGPWQVFVRVVLPQLRVAIAGGSLLIALHLLAEYGLYAMIRFDTFTTAIVDQFQSAHSGPAAHMLAGVLVALCMALLWLETRLRGDARQARVGAGAARDLPAADIGRWKFPAVIFLAVLGAGSIGIPYAMLAKWLAAGGIGIWQDAAIASAMAQTAGLAVLGATLATVVVVPMAWISVRHPGRLQRALEACHYYAGSLPGVVVALAVVAATVRIPYVYQSVAAILFAYALLFLPRALASLRAGFAQVPVELEWAAASLGRSPARSMWQITLRLSAPSVAAAFALVALATTTELTATLMLAPTGTRTLATEFWSLTSEIDYIRAAPYAVLMTVLSLPLSLWLRVQSKRVSGR